MEIGRNIERARNRKGWTQAQLGEAVCLHQARISQFERNAGKPTLPQIVAISDVTGASLDELLRGGEPAFLVDLNEAEQLAVDFVRELRLNRGDVIRAFAGIRATDGHPVTKGVTALPPPGDEPRKQGQAG